MDLFDRYVQALRIFLPKGQQDDIIQELSDDVQSEMEEKEAELGRPLSEAEQADVLEHYGHPILVASRYRPHRQLIGPVLFPFYWLTLRLGIALTIAVHVIGALALLAGDTLSLHDMVQPLRTLPGALLRLFGWMTLMFAGLEIYLTRTEFFEKWDPSGLPPLVHREPQARRSASMAQFVIALVFSAWYLAGLKRPYLLLGAAASTLDFAPIWRQLYVPILLLALADLARQGITLVRPHWTRPLFVIRAVTTFAKMVVLYFLLTASHWVVAVANDSGAERDVGTPTANLIDLVNHAIFLGLIVAGVVMATGAVLDVRRLVRTFVKAEGLGVGS